MLTYWYFLGTEKVVEKVTKKMEEKVTKKMEEKVEVEDISNLF